MHIIFFFLHFSSQFSMTKSTNTVALVTAYSHCCRVELVDMFPHMKLHQMLLFHLAAKIFVESMQYTRGS